VILIFDQKNNWALILTARMWKSSQVLFSSLFIWRYFEWIIRTWLAFTHIFIKIYVRCACIFDLFNMRNVCLMFVSLWKRGKKGKIPAAFKSAFLIVNGMWISVLWIESLNRKGRMPAKGTFGDRICPIDGVEFRGTSTTATVVFTSLVCEARLCCRAVARKGVGGKGLAELSDSRWLTRTAS